MCSHFHVAQCPETFVEYFGIAPEAVASRPDGIPEESAPTDPVAAILRNPKTTAVELRYPRWGLIPYWEKDLRSAAKRINARAETIAEMPAFREAFRKRRCIVPMAYFNEYDRTSKYRIGMADGSDMGVAGLWEWRKMENEPVLVTCTVITVPANTLIATVHDRMPAVLEREQYLQWLDNGDSNGLSRMLAPFDPDQMKMEFDSFKKTARKRGDTGVTNP